MNVDGDGDAQRRGQTALTLSQPRRLVEIRCAPGLAGLERTLRGVGMTAGGDQTLVGMRLLVATWQLDAYRPGQLPPYATLRRHVP